MKEIKIFVTSEDGKKPTQTYRVGSSRTSLVKDGESNAKVTDLAVNDVGEVVVITAVGQVVYGNAPYRYVQ